MSVDASYNHGHLWLAFLEYRIPPQSERRRKDEGGDADRG